MAIEASLPRGFAVTSPATKARTAASASLRSALPRLRLFFRDGRDTSATRTPRLWSTVQSPRPYDPVPSIATAEISPRRKAQITKRS